jgi:membrane associated rhomboid family serine protease
MIPLKDDIPTKSIPWVTIGLILTNIIVFLYQATLPPHRELELTLRFGLVPGVVTRLPELDAGSVVPSLLSFVTSMFLHGSVIHLGGNMLFLWIFGNNVEDSLGRARYSLFYLLCGLTAAVTQVAALPRSAVPMVGASGAIAGVLGAYFLLFPSARILTLVPFFFVYLVRLPAFVVLGMWFLFQVLYSTMSVGGPGGGVAWYAHIGGFLAGMLLLGVFLPRRRRGPPPTEAWI